MAKKTAKFIPLFSKEAGVILTQPVLQERTGQTYASLDSTTTKQLQSHEIQPDIGLGMDSEREVVKTDIVSGGRDLFCQSCRISLADREEQVTHYRLDWHRYNLKRKLKGLTHVRQEYFEKIAGDLSSISGSESDSDHHSEEEERPQLFTSDDVLTTPSRVVGSPYIHFTSAKDGERYATYRSVLSGSKLGVGMEESGDLLKALTKLKEQQTWIVLMRAGGHFAGAVFKGTSLVAHKTFHRYTVRAKRGTAQSVRDSQGHAPKSAGATLRRYNETALVQEIQELIGSWSTYIEEASAIFIRTPKYSRGTFVRDGSKSGSGGGQAPFSKGDPRLRSIPFATRRPTLKEVRNAHSKLATIYVNVEPLGDTDRQKTSKPKQKEKAGDMKPSKVVASTNNVVDEARDEIGAVIELDVVNEQDDIDEERESHLMSGSQGGDGEKVTKKKKKKKAKKIPSEAIPENFLSLLKLCISEGSEQELTEQLLKMGLKPLHSPSTIAQEEQDNASTQPDEGIQPSSTVDSCQEGTNGGEEKRIRLEEDCLTPNKAQESEASATVGGASTQPEIVVTREELNKLWNGETILHVASSNGCTDLVPILLLYGANPTIRNQSGHTPYLVAKDKAVRDSFRRFMAAFPSIYDYNAAQVPSPLTEDMERERKEKQAEKKKAHKKARKQKEKERKAERELASVADSRGKAVEQLSEREKRALAAERRMAKQLPSSTAVIHAGSCAMCSESLAGVVPFERLQYKYCSMNCLKTHRTQLTSNQ